MLETGSMVLLLLTKEDTEKVYREMQQILSEAMSWRSKLALKDVMIFLPEGTEIQIQEYRGLPEKISTVLASKYPDMEIRFLSDYYSEAGEVHHQFVLYGGQLSLYKSQYEYLSDQTKEEIFRGIRTGGHYSLVQDALAFTEQESIQCEACKEFFMVSSEALLTRCPYCGKITDHFTTGKEGEETEHDNNPPVYVWQNHEYEIPLGVTFPTIPISAGTDWIQDCEKDEAFELDPVWFENPRKYTAARNLCRACAGWFTFMNQEERDEHIACYRESFLAKKGEPMWYYDPDRNSFDWIAAVRENNPRYIGKFFDIDGIWELFNRLSQRSFLEKADCFEWIAAFFGETLKYDYRNELTRSYLQYRDQYTEMILFHRPDEIRILTDRYRENAYDLAILSYAAAGLIRMGKREEGLEIYKKVFNMSLNPQVSVDERKNVITAFLDRMGQGYENEPCIDEWIAAIIEEQCTHFSDKSFSIRVKLAMKQ